MQSYTSQPGNLFSLILECLNLTRSYRRDVAADLCQILGRLKEMEARLHEFYGVEFREMRMLDVGVGQRLIQMTYFAAKGNEVVGIDRDVIARGWAMRPYFRMLRENGAKRVVKTLGRKALGADRRYAAELRRQLGISSTPKLDVHQMDACALQFQDGSFDAVYSLAVLMHVDRPQAAVSEVARVLRPGGVAYIQLIPFTAHIGALDIRSIGGVDTGLPRWAHLRPSHRGRVLQSAYLNRLRLNEWEQLFRRNMPGCKFVHTQPERQQLEPEALRLKDAGELTDYDVEELVTSVLSVMWRKPFN